ncbi:unnamed protein product [Linum tenue]|uniref:Uncharacterized protein n=1 Tax=Linum tenue TaxID=586396 RepID=A0AAV0LA54_9ROSI|nr:unnamed protein product [Linum tenue]
MALLHLVRSAAGEPDPVPGEIWEVVLHQQLLQGSHPGQPLLPRLLQNHPLQGIKAGKLLSERNRFE